MTTLDFLKYAALGLYGIFAWGLVCIAIWGVPKTSKREAEELADQAEALKAKAIAQEDQWLAELERGIPIMQDRVDMLRTLEPTLDNIRERARISVALSNAEKARMTLKQRRAFPQQTAATVFEGRM